ncbi:hypothetical protein ACFLYO_01525 [Chloroflexota bacterium]
MSIEHTPEHQSLPPEPGPLPLQAITRQAKELALLMGHHVPTLLVAGSEQNIGGHFDEMPPTHADRVQLMHAAGQTFGEQDALGSLQQVIFITEAWLSVVSDENHIELPSQDPDRKEVLCISSLNVQQRQHDLTLFEMIRDEQGNLVDLQDFQVGDPQMQKTDSPLLSAFVAGYKSGRARRTN